MTSVTTNWACITCGTCVTYMLGELGIEIGCDNEECAKNHPMIVKPVPVLSVDKPLYWDES